MPSLSYGISAFDRDKGYLPELKCVNLYAEGARTSEGQICLQSREGLSSSYNLSSGAVVGLYSEPGIFSGDVFAIRSTTLYRGTSSLGTVAVSGGKASFAATATQLVVAAGGTPRIYDGATLSNIAFPDGASVRAVAILNFVFYAIRGDTTYPGRIYFSAVNDGSSWDPLDYFTAERVPDKALDLIVLNDNLWIFGESSVEPMQVTGNADAPMRRIPQVSFDVGIIDTGACCKADNSVWWIGSDACVYRAQDGRPMKVSEPWLNAKIRAATSWRMFTYERDGEEFICVRLGGTSGTTWVLPVSTQSEWCQFQTSTSSNWVAQCAVMQGRTPYFGHQTTGDVMTFDGWDDLGTVVTRQFTAATLLDAPVSIDNVRLWVNAGQVPTGVTGTLYMKDSRDAGNTWSSEVSVSIGNATDGGSAEYRKPVTFRARGLFDRPGAMFEFRFASESDFRVSAVKVNEPGGGRSRA